MRRRCLQCASASCVRIQQPIGATTTSDRTRSALRVGIWRAVASCSTIYSRARQRQSTFTRIVGNLATSSSGTTAVCCTEAPAMTPTAIGDACARPESLAPGRRSKEREGLPLAKVKYTAVARVYAALVGNLFVAATKFLAAFWTGSSSMFSEGVHSLVDTLNEGLLLYGFARAKRRPDIVHPLGYGRELYFWSFIVALLVFAVGAGVSFYEGALRVLNPVPITNPVVNYVVLGFSFVFEGASWWVAYRAFQAVRGDLGYWDAVRRSKDPPSFMVLFEDTAALVGIA